MLQLFPSPAANERHREHEKLYPQTFLINNVTILKQYNVTNAKKNYLSQLIPAKKDKLNHE